MSRDAIDEAAAWLAAQHADDVDWDGFTSWLEADPRHRTVFDELVLLESRVDEHRADLIDADRPVAGRRGGLRWAAIAAGGMIAASLGLIFARTPTPADAVWRSGPSTRTLALADGVAVQLAPHSRLTARHGDTRRLAVAGTALFDVRHDSSRKLAVAVGPLTVRDIGTRFEVSGAHGVAHVAVAEGTVTVEADGADDVRLDGGASLDDADGRLLIGRADPTAIGSWRRGELTYSQTPLALVAADIERYSGRKVTIDPRLAATRFSGVLTIGDGSRLATTVAAVMGLEVRRDGGGVRLEPRR